MKRTKKEKKPTLDKVRRTGLGIAIVIWLFSTGVILGAMRPEFLTYAVCVAAATTLFLLSCWWMHGNKPPKSNNQQEQQ